MHLRVNTPQVIHETIDHEVVIINLGTGTYYSLEGTGEEIWSLLHAGTPTENLAHELGARYGADPSALALSIEPFVEELLSESLVVEAESAMNSNETAGSSDKGSGATFEPPVLERFTEMQHLIALDPIHEVDEGQGWPHT